MDDKTVETIAYQLMQAQDNSEPIVRQSCIVNKTPGNKSGDNI
jgi:hypothetical protein